MPLLQTPQELVTVQSQRTIASASKDATSYEGNVVVRYGSIKIVADRVVLYRSQGWGTAEGHVMLIDPSGTTDLERLDFSWDDKVKVQSLRTVASASAGSVAYEGDVVVRYGFEKVLADRVVLFRGEKRGVAEGNVTLIDRDGTARADRLEFSWDEKNRFGTGDNVEIRVANATLRARRATFEPGKWTLVDAEGTTCLRRTPVYLVTTSRVVVRPGENLVAEHPRISFLGKFIGQLPTQNLSLTPAVPGVHLPSPGYKLKRGFGLTWSGGLIIGKESTFNFRARSFQQRKPAAYALFTHSFLPLKNATEIVGPRTDFGERFNFGFLDSIVVDDPAQEARYLRASRLSLSGGGQVNGGIADRNRGTRYSKIEGIYEAGGARGSLGLLGQVRLQSIQREQEGMEQRVALYGSAGLPSVKLAPGLSTISRLDAAAFGGRTAYGWGRAMLGLSYAPKPWLRLSAGGFVSGDAGTPQFAIDPLYSESGLLMRGDLAFGGLRLSYLLKNDARRGLYDHEISINQVIGCFEAFYLLREYPNDRRLGLSVRVQPLIDLAKKRGLNGKSETKPRAKPNVQ